MRRRTTILDALPVSQIAPHPSSSFSATLRVHLDNHPGAFAGLAKAIGDAGGLLGAIDLVRVEHGKKVRDVTVLAADDEHVARIVAGVEAVDGIEIEHVSDRTFLLHLGGKLEVMPKSALKTRDDLSMAYTPGVARVSSAIAADPEKAWNLTIKQNAVAVVTDGSAVLGLGDIGPEAALPVMEGKAMLFKEFGGIDAWPVCLDTKDPDEIVRTVELLAPVFGGVNLEDISAPRCFEIESRLRDALEIPVFHDDQHGTAIVVLAALLNALELVGKRLEAVRIVITGAGAAGAAVARMLLGAGAGEVLCADRSGLLCPGRTGLDPFKAELAGQTNARGASGSPDDALAGADVYIGLSTPGAVTPEAIRTMAADAVVFAMANPNPEVPPGGDRGRGRRSGHRALGLPEPDQQCARVPRRLPRRARRTRPHDHAGDGDRRGARPCRGRRAGPPGGRLRDPERLRPAGRACGRRCSRFHGDGIRRRTTHAPGAGLRAVRVRRTHRTTREDYVSGQTSTLCADEVGAASVRGARSSST